MILSSYNVRLDRSLKGRVGRQRVLCQIISGYFTRFWDYLIHVTKLLEYERRKTQGYDKLTRRGSEGVHEWVGGLPGGFRDSSQTHRAAEREMEN